MIEQLISDFSNNQLSNFLRNNNSSFVDYLEDFSELISDNEKFTNLYKLGEIEYDNTDKLIVFTCKFKNELTSRSARKAQFELAKIVLKEDFNDGAVFVFYDQAGRFRFSFIRRNYGDRKQKYTPWKRYTYFVEPDAATNRTFKERIGNCKFDSLDNIQEAFSVDKLTKDFYKEISDWYFWAIKNVSFPNNVQDDSDDDKYNPESMIRLITRLIFVWFLKQKGLIRNELFETSFLSNTLKEFNPESDTQNNYYRAILQNLFFATLNQEVNKRDFAEDKDFFSNRATNSIKNLYRYESEFKCENTAKIMELFKQIPFLNGGLFECLDNKKKDGKNYDWDGFSRNPKRQAKVPNMLFFAKDTKVDLSDVYNDKKFKSVHVAGIIEILNRYNFTVEENTPVEIEVALDPELLGKVFENLLGAYNPETQETARKQTGSFYTPREIVNYMVDESLIAYYKTKVPDVDEDSLRLLVSYDEQTVIINESQRELLIQATFDCKILDPACGSGAFPMGILQQMVHILKKLDPDNTYWNNLVMSQAMSDFEKSDKLSDDDIVEIREEIEKTFNTGLNYPDYARKLYLIKNCIYGVDIQSIAVQISKLRFFISLVTEQIQNTNIEENFGIKPLPNLETKFVAANTLIGLEKTEEELVLLNNDHIKTLIDKLQNIRFRQFLVTNVTEKKRLRDKDEKLRLEIENEVSRLYVKHIDDQLDNYKKELSLAEKQLSLLNQMPEDIRETITTDLFGTETKTIYNFTESKRRELKGRIKLLNGHIQLGADYSRLDSIVKLAKQLTSWNPYNQNESSPFFDSEWMFGLEKENEGYFDLVIGNPPYINVEKIEIDLKNHLFSNYQTCKGRTDVYIAFIEKATLLLKKNRICTYIIPYSYTNQNYAELSRLMLVTQYYVSEIVDTSNYYVFDSAVVKNIILRIEKSSNKNHTQIKIAENSNSFITSHFRKHTLNQNVFLNLQNIRFETKNLSSFLEIKSKIELKSILLKDVCLVAYGARLNHKSDKSKPKSYYISNVQQSNLKKFIEGKNIERYHHTQNGWLNYNPDEHYNSMFPELFETIKIITINVISDRLRFSLDDNHLYNSHTVINCVNISELQHVNHISAKKAIINGKLDLAKTIDMKYLLGLLNSYLINWYFKKFQSEGLHFYPDDAKKLPIRIIKNQEVIINLVNAVLYKTKNNTKHIEQQIDNIVYRLYDLTYDEVKMIDPEIENKISEVDYNAIEV